MPIPSSRSDIMTKPVTARAVLVLAPTPYFSDRGCHIRIYEETKLIQRLGYTVQLVTYPLGRNVGDLKITRTAKLPWYRKTSAGPAWSKLILDLLLARRAYQLCKRERPVLIHAHLQESFWIGYLLKKRFHIPLVLDLQSLLIPELRSYGGVWKWLAVGLQWYERWAIRGADVVVVSNSNAQQLLGKQYPNTIVHLLADGVGDILQDDVVPQYDFVYSGGLGIAKGTDLMFTALDQVAKQYPIRALIIAKPRPSHVPEYIDWIEHVPYEELLPKLAEAKFGLDPKPLTTTEGSGKRLNYLAAGVEPITLTAQTQTATAFANDLLQKLNTPRPVDIVEQLKHQAASEYSWKNQTTLLQSIYEQALRSV